jgi:U2 small nuclear ribonucleoprotein B''
LISSAKKWYVDLTCQGLNHANMFIKKIVYAKGQSHIIPKLRGTFEQPTATIGAAETTDLQKSIFNAPPSSIPTKPSETNDMKPVAASLPEPPHGVKRPRDEEEEEKDEKEADEDGAEEAPMEEDDESDAPMEASSDED